jgi:hypothetical protein
MSRSHDFRYGLLEVKRPGLWPSSFNFPVAHTPEQVENSIQHMSRKTWWTAADEAEVRRAFARGTRNSN